MRSIKFRAWAKRNEFFIDNIQDSYDGIGPDDPFDCFGGALDNDDYVVEQYTGLKDKNGKEIYEGDVIRGDTGWIGKIIWSRFGFRVVILDNNQPDSFSLDYASPNIQILGNVHENLG